MIRSGQKILSVLLLLPVLTILAHNSIPHHHHVSMVEICCANQQMHDETRHLFNSTGQPAAGHHDACSFNPVFTIDLFKILVTVAAPDQTGMTCPSKWIESEQLVWFTDDALCRISPSPNLLRGPPTIL